MAERTAGAEAFIGVGMGLKSRSDGSIEVTEIVLNGPVHHCGKVRSGDVLKKINGKDVGKTVASARELLVGPAGTHVTLHFARHEALFGFDAVKVENIFSVSVLRTPAAISSGPGPDEDHSGVHNREARSAQHVISTEKKSDQRQQELADDFNSLLETQDRIRALENRRSENRNQEIIQETRDKIRSLESENQGLRTERDVMYQRLGEANEKARSAWEQLRKCKEENTALQKGHSKLLAQISQLTDSNSQLQEERTLRQHSEEREKKMNVNLISLQDHLEKLQREKVTLTQENITLKSEKEISKDGAASLQLQLTQSKQELDLHSSQASRALADLEQLRSENARMEQLLATDQKSVNKELEDVRSELSRLREVLQSAEMKRTDSNSTLVDLNNALKQSLKEAESQLEDTKRAERELRLEVSRLRTQVVEASSDSSSLVADLRNEVSDASGKIAAARKREAELMDEAEDLRQKLHSAQMVIAALRTRLETSTTGGNPAIGELTDRLNKMQGELRSSQMERRELMSLVDTLKGKAENASKEADTLREEKDALQSKVAEIERFLSSATDEKKELQRKLSGVQAEMVTMADDKVELQRKVSALEVEMVILKNDKIVLVQKLTRAERELTFMREERGELQSKMLSLNGQVATLKSEKMQLQNQVSSADADAHTRKVELLRKLSAIEVELVDLKGHRVDLEHKLSVSLGEIASLNKEKLELMQKLGAYQTNAGDESARLAKKASQEAEAARLANEELRAKVSELDNHVAQLEQKLQEAQINTDAARSEALDCLRNLERSQNEKADLERKLEHSEMAVKSADEELNRKLADSLSKLNEDKADLQTKLDGAEIALKEWRDGMDEEIIGVEEEVILLNNEKKGWSAEKERLHEQLSELSRRVKVMGIERDDFVSTVAGLENDNASLKNELSALTDKAADLENHVIALQNEKVELIRKHTKQEEETSALQEQCVQYQNKVRDAEAATALGRAESETALAVLRKELEIAHEENHRLSGDIGRLEREVAGAVDEKDDMRRSLQQIGNAEESRRELLAKLAEKHDEIEILQKEKRTLANQLATSQAEVTNLKESTQSMEASVAQGQERISSLEYEKTELANKLDEVNAVRKGEADQIRRKLAESEERMRVLEKENFDGVSALIRAQVEVEESAAEILSLRMAADARRAETEILGEKARERGEQIESLKRDLAASQKEASAANSGLRQSGEQALEAALQEVETHRQESARVREEMESTVEKMQNELDGALRDLADAEVRASNAESARMVVERQLAQREKQIVAGQQTQTELQTEHTDLLRLHTEALERAQNAEARISKLKEDLEGEGNKLKESQREIEGLKCAKEDEKDKENKLQTSERQVRVLQTRLQAAERGAFEMNQWTQSALLDSSAIKMAFEQMQLAGHQEGAQAESDRLQVLSELLREREERIAVLLADKAASRSAERERQETQLEGFKSREAALMQSLKEAREASTATGVVGTGTDSEVLRAQVGRLKHALEGKELEVKTLKQSLQALTASAAEAEAMQMEMEELRQHHNQKQKDHLERTQKERAKIAEEMRSAFKELTVRQEKLDASGNLIQQLDKEIALLCECLEACEMSEKGRHVLKRLSGAQKESAGMRTQLERKNSGRQDSYLPAVHNSPLHHPTGSANVAVSQLALEAGPGHQSRRTVAGTSPMRSPRPISYPPANLHANGNQPIADSRHSGVYSVGHEAGHTGAEHRHLACVPAHGAHGEIRHGDVGGVMKARDALSPSGHVSRGRKDAREDEVDTGARASTSARQPGKGVLKRGESVDRENAANKRVAWDLGAEAVFVERPKGAMAQAGDNDTVSL